VRVLPHQESENHVHVLKAHNSEPNGDANSVPQKHSDWSELVHNNSPDLALFSNLVSTGLINDLTVSRIAYLGLRV
jgi:hypothetical protein